MSESNLIPVIIFAECVPESQLSPGFAWLGRNFRFASVEDSAAARLTQFPAPFLWLAFTSRRSSTSAGGWGRGGVYGGVVVGSL